MTNRADGPTVAAVMIARNEERCIARSLQSVKPYVDEIVVMDTGSTDQTVDIAVAHGARVGHFAWCDDFSAARNAALEFANADWSLTLDADEWLESGGEELRRALSWPPTRVGAVLVHNEYEQARETHCVSEWMPRLSPAVARFEGRVHEQLAPHLPRVPINAAIRHDGYAPASLARKIGRNEKLLRAALIERPADGYLRYQLGRDLEQQSRFQEAAAEYAAARGSTPHDEPWRHDLDVRSIYVAKRCKDYQQGLNLAEASFQNWPTSPDVFFAAGDLFLDAGAENRRQGEELLLLAVQSWSRCLEIGDRPDLVGSVTGRGSYLAAENLAIVFELLGDDNLASAFRLSAKDMRSK